MKFLVNSKELSELIKKMVTASDITLISEKVLKDLQKTSSQIDCIFVSYGQPSSDKPISILPLLKQLAAEAPQIPVFALDIQFSLSHHNEVTDFRNVVGYGQIGHIVTNSELEELIEEIREREVINKKVTSISKNKIRKVGWSIQIDKERDFKDEYADKLYLGEMRSFINNLKRIIDKIRPEKFTPDHTDGKPLLDWLEMWSAHKHGATHYPDPNSNSLKEIDDKEIDDARKLFEAKRNNPNVQHILIRGQSGAGKTFIANFIHNYYYRGCKKGWYKKMPTIVSCPELKGNLAVPTLFGCLTGAWTDSRTRAGYLLESYNGTLFLDEIGAASPEIQEKLLRYLDHQDFRPDGWSHQEGIYVPLLVVAATKEPLKEWAEQGKFREDLYFRFLEIEIPPLKSCKDYFEVYIDCELQNPRTNSGFIDSITTDAIDILRNYDYPGNFREFHRILGLAVEEAKSMRLKTVVKEHVDSAMRQMGVNL
jgi:transcriptional regulator with PAS, ATPase and Fis domain